MNDWRDDIEREMRRAETFRHPGQTRSAARRIAGIALRQVPEVCGRLSGQGDVLMLLRILSELSGIPEPARAAATRLHMRLDTDFSSPSKDPLADAKIIVDYVESLLSPGEHDQ